jgi:ABC-type microcin C transport system permease subunit YejB
MKEKLIDVFWHVIAPVVYLAVVIYVLLKVWNKNKQDNDEE